MEHLTISANGAQFHVAKTGTGEPLLLLHGWPEFWLSWEPLMQRLQDRFTLIAPDLRGFGKSDKPVEPFGPPDHAKDMVALLDAFGIKRARVVGHDVGGAIMQPLARSSPDRLVGLFFFDFVYPGIGPRMAEPDRTQGDLVPVVQPDGNGTDDRRRDTARLRNLHWTFSPALVLPKRRL